MSKMKIISGSVLIVSCLTLILLIVFVKGCSYWQGPHSDHFKENRFINNEPDNTFSDHLKWLWEMETVEWPKWIDDPPQPRPLSYVKENNILRVTYVNHASVLIQTDGVNILTDPIWSECASPVSWAGAKRIRAPGIKFNELPKIDIILISHDHYDHLDIPTLKKIIGTSHPLILGGLGITKRLNSLKYDNVKQLDWWQEYSFSPTGKITFVPSRHSSGRGMFDKNKTLWGGFVIKVPVGNVLFVGDTAFGEFFKDIKRKFSRFRLTILPIGSYEKRWFMKSQHMNPDDAVQVHKKLNASKSMGIHFATFNEHAEQTVDAHEKDLKIALKKYNVPENDFWILKFGEGRELKM